MKKEVYEVTYDEVAFEVQFGDDATCLREAWRKNGALHRENGPAVTLSNPEWAQYLRKEWHKNGKLHRDDDEPAVITTNMYGTLRQHWYKNGKLHREGDEPATLEIHPDTGIHSYSGWYKNGMLHRELGPAWITRDDCTGVSFEEFWYKDGVLHRPRSEQGILQPAAIFRDDRTGVIEVELFYLDGELQKYGQSRGRLREHGTGRIMTDDECKDFIEWPAEPPRMYTVF